MNQRKKDNILINSTFFDNLTHFIPIESFSLECEWDYVKKIIHD